ncbi:hypothetical protein HS048_20545 [Planomonospora sp. ID91781]|uniref:hypothetical protein n=1 Tax=Planomonospora sp. ID91781 TaxID=2738135 RepID=UPI0018C38CD6|nr:hypothetical protein [Planomonospora sp. ID91781]MBG0823128.1 hypothetical protein [Planomonospora sp. ID91781]
MTGSPLPAPAGPGRPGSDDLHEHLHQAVAAAAAAGLPAGRGPGLAAAVSREDP